MTVAFKELAGSPLETYGPDGMKAQRVLVCGWDDRELVVEQLLGDGYEFGGRGRAGYPDKPNVVAMRIRCEPFADDVTPQVLDELTEGLNRYHGFAKVTVSYELLVACDREDLPAVEEGTLLTYRQQPGSETMILPGHALTWAGAPDVPVPPEAVPAIHVPIVEHHFTWQRVVRPPWEAIRQSVGTVNDAVFMGAAAATVLFVGATTEREFIRIDELANPALSWRLGYLFREKAVKTGTGSVAGWNHAYRSLPADGPGWDELVDAGGNRPYPSSDFSPLFQFAATD
jgi:hypothetical protein